jgi:hypothetical protein
MESELKIENIGYVANNNPFRAVLDGNEFRGLIPAPEWNESIVRRNATVDETVLEMKRLIKKSAWQTKDLAQRLQGKNIYDTCSNIWNFLFKHIKYREDDAGKEQLRTPALSWYLRRKRGIDCDDFSIFAGTILYNLHIPFYLRIARYAGKDYFQHVYVTIPKTQKNYIIIDAVLDEYDAEKEPIQTKDFLVMENSNLNGIDISVLGDIGDDVYNELSGILNGDDFAGLDGLGDISEEEGLNAVYNHLVRTRNFVRRHPNFIRQVENPQVFLGMLDYAIGYWNTDKRDDALGILEEQEEKMNFVNGLSGMPDGYEEVGLFYGMENLSGVALLGKAKAKKGFFKNIKKVVQKVKEVKKRVDAKAKAVIKKVAKKIIRFDPAVTTVRVGIIAALKTNFLKIASRLKVGYYTEDEARKKGMDMVQWANARKVLQDAENLFVNKFQGKPENFRKAILTGRAGGLNSLDDLEGLGDLGVYAAAAAGGGATTAAAAATPWIKKVLDLMKKVDWGKLITNVKKTGIFNRKKKKAEQQMEKDEASPPEETAPVDADTGDPIEQTTSIPTDEGGDTSSNISDTTPIENNSGGGGNETENESLEASTNIKTDQSDSSNTENNLPAVTDKNLPDENSESGRASSEAREGEGFFDKAKTWVKENPGTSVVIAGGVVLGVWGLTKMLGKRKESLSGARRGRKKRGKHKTNPPRALKGAKRKRGGSGPKQINL